MELTHIEHLGIAVKSIEACLPYYEGVLGLKCYNIEEVADQKVKTAFFKVGLRLNYWSRLAKTARSRNLSRKKVKVSTISHSRYLMYRPH